MSSRFPWRREATKPPLPEKMASEQRAADILSLRLSAPEPPPDFIYQRRSDPEPEQKTARWMGPSILVLLFVISLGVGVMVVRGLRDGLVADRSDLPVITAQEAPAKSRAPEQPAAGATTSLPEPEQAQAADAPPRPSDTLERLLAGRTGNAGNTAETPAPTPAPAPAPEPEETTSVIPAAPDIAALARQILSGGYEDKPAAEPEPRSAPRQEQTAAATPQAGPAAAAEPTRYTVEIIAPSSLEEAKDEWARLQRSYPELLGDTTLELRRVALEGNRVVYRGLAGYLPSESTALDFCAQINATDTQQHCQVLARKPNEQVALASPAEPDAQNAGQAAAAQTGPGAADSNVVRLVKLGLKRAGFDPGTLDGRATPQLATAIQGYQRKHSLAVDGQASRDLLDHMLGAQVAQIQPAAKPAEPPQAASQAAPAPRPEPAPAPAAAARVPVPAETAPAQPREQQTAAVAPAQPAAPQTSVQPNDPGKWLIGRGDELLALGDVASARLFYEEAMGLGSASGATALGKTYDPLFFQEVGVRGPVADPQQAVSLYSRAAQAGDPAARQRLEALQRWLQRNN